MRISALLLCACSSSPATDGGTDAALDQNAMEGSAEAATDAKSDGPPALSCTDYCDAIGVNCLAPQQQYFSSDVCSKWMCPVFQMGAFGDMKNSLGCRQYYAGDPSMSDPGMHCRQAGPSGGGTCGTRCDAFCQLTFAICLPMYKNAVNPFSSMMDCMSQCTMMTVDAVGPEIDTTGRNTLNCRFYELEIAFSDPAGGSAKNHCPNLVTASPTCTK